MSPHFSAARPFERRLRKVTFKAREWLRLTPYVVTAQGARFVVDKFDYIDRCLAFYGMWEKEQLEKLVELCSRRRIDTFLDVGANVGFYSIMFAVKKAVDRIIAFEPDPGNYSRLRANLSASDLEDRIETVQLALGDRESPVKLYQGAEANRGESTIAVPEQTPQEVTHQVRQARFDDLYQVEGESIIVKMDVEGYEFQALAGMERTLRDNACHLQIEHYGTELDRLRDLLDDWGYRFLYTLEIDHVFSNMPDVE